MKCPNCGSEEIYATVIGTATLKREGLWSWAELSIEVDSTCGFRCGTCSEDLSHNHEVKVRFEHLTTELISHIC